MHLRSRYFLLLAAPLFLTVSLRAQAVVTGSTPGHQEVDLAVTYTAQYSNLVSDPTFWHQGGSIELSTQTYRGFGVAANIAGTQIGNAANSGVGLSMVTATFGPRYTWYRPIGEARKKSLAIFGQGLIGEAHGFNSYFPTAAGSLTVTSEHGGDVTVTAVQHHGGDPVGFTVSTTAPDLFFVVTASNVSCSDGDSFLSGSPITRVDFCSGANGCL